MGMEVLWMSMGDDIFVLEASGFYNERASSYVTNSCFRWTTMVSFVQTCFRRQPVFGLGSPKAVWQVASHRRSNIIFSSDDSRSLDFRGRVCRWDSSFLELRLGHSWFRLCGSSKFFLCFLSTRAVRDYDLWSRNNPLTGQRLPGEVAGKYTRLTRFLTLEC